MQRAVGRVIPSNPVDLVQLTQPTQKAEQRRALTAEEQQWIWDTPHRAQPVAAIMMLAGLRRGELAALTWARLTRQVLSEEGAAILSPLPHQGLPALRRAICSDLRDFRGLSASPEQIVIGAGAEYLYLLLAQLLGRDTVLAVEDPGYPKIRQVYEKSGVRCVSLPLDGEGMNPDTLRESGAGAVHLSPSHQYPTGLVTPIRRRQELLRWAEETGGGIIEDDYDSELRFTGRPIPPLQSIDGGGRVAYLNTFSQTIAPSMDPLVTNPSRKMPRNSTSITITVANR